MARVGILGGSFNPIHLGHLHLAETVRERLALDEVILMPAGEAPHKSSAEYAQAADRLAMCRLAAQAYPWMSVSDFELFREGKSYSIYTLEHLRAQRPTDALFFLIGSDMLLSFDQWYRYREILSLCTLAVISRSPQDTQKLAAAAAPLEQFGAVEVLDAAPFVASSTEIRERIKFHQDFSCYLPEKVVQYILLKKLYHAGI